MKLQERAGKVGFDWNDVRAVLAKFGEEIAEVEAEIANGSAETLSGEVGDLFFTAVNLARHLKVDPEAALRGANAKFERRFAHIESRLAEDGRTPESASLDEMEQLWAEAKAQGAPGGMSDSEMKLGYVALLRGVNVGGARPLPMEALRALFAEAGASER